MSLVLHVIGRATLGGAGRLAVTTAALDDGHEHRMLTLCPAAEGIVELLDFEGVPVIAAPGPDAMAAEVAAADIVLVHWWNSPEVGEFLRADLPPMRLIVWSMVGGDTAPQMITPELVRRADRMVVVTPFTLGLPVITGVDASLIEPLIAKGRIGYSERVAHDDFAVGYIGTVDPVKMHPEFVSLCADIDVPDARFVVCGMGDGFAAISLQAQEMGIAERFELRGFISEPDPVFAELDVFGYPLCPGNYSGTEMVLMEALLAGVPPVVLPYGGVPTTVNDGVTGIVAADEAAYARGVELLARDPELRARLAGEGRRVAAERWSPETFEVAWIDAFDEILKGPKSTGAWPGDEGAGGAEKFIAHLGASPERDLFAASLQPAEISEAMSADAAIVELPTVFARSDGGVLDYRRAYQDDSHLRLWAGLVLSGTGSRVLAAGELAQARRMGIDDRRVTPRIEAISGALAR